MVFSKYCATCPAKVYDKKFSSTFTEYTETEATVTDDGFAVSGKIASDKMCIDL